MPDTLSYEQQLLSDIDALLGTAGEQLVIPYSKINQVIVDTVGNNSKVVTRMVEKIIRGIDRHTVKAADRLDAVQTTVLAGLDAYLQNAHSLLQQLAVKGDVLRPGDPVTAALLEAVTEAPGVTYAGTLVLAVKEAVPWLERITVALETIALRMPPTPAQATKEIEDELPSYEVDAADVPSDQLDDAPPGVWE
jgi:hypothetical protein